MGRADLIAIPPPTRPDRRLGIARTFQNVQLFRDMSALDNILVAMPSHMRVGLLAEALSLPFLHRREHRVRDKAPEIVNCLGLAAMQQPAGNLPLGLQERLELGRALRLAPKLLLLDEPAGLNTSETHELPQLMGKIRERFKLTILLAEHDMGLVMSVCDTITVLNFGQKLAEGTAVEVQNRPEVIQAYLGRPSVQSSREPGTNDTRQRPLLTVQGIETFYGNIQASEEGMN